MTFPFPQIPPIASFAFSNTANAAIDTTSGSATITFSSMAAGAAASDRYLFAAIGFTATSNIDFSSVTIGGVSATLIVKITNSDVNLAAAGIYGALVPTGTTASVAVTATGTLGGNRGMSCSLFRMVGKSSMTAFATNSATQANTTAALACNVNTAAGGWAIAVSTGMGVSGSCTWVGLSELSDQTSGTATMISQAGNAIVSGSTPLSVSADFTNGGAGQSIVSASWSP